MKRFSILFLSLFWVSTGLLFAQNQCFTEAEAKKIIESINASPIPVEKNEIRQELLKMLVERQKLHTKIAENVEKNRNLIPEANLLGEKHLVRICEILKEHGWLRMAQIQEDGFSALTYLITNNKAFQMQRELLPVLSEAAKKGFIKNVMIASMVDNIRVGSGLPQIFGTQATIRNEVIYLYPLLNEEKVDEWRAIYDLQPLAWQIRQLEKNYMMPLLKMKRPPAPPNLTKKTTEKSSDTAILGITEDEEEVVKVDTKLVNLNIRILTQDLKVPSNLNFSKEDFTILEDGKEQEIAFFSTVDQPFDLVLVLDFSGSTTGKQDLIKKAAEKFVESARPNDRISVVAFANQIELVAELTTDKKILKKGIDKINLRGGSPIWDSLQFSYQNIIQKESRGRRNAIVIMTDGDDGSRNTTFADLFETVRKNDTTIFPVYVVGEEYNTDWWKKNRQKSRQSLNMLAEESGGQLYQANQIKDLNGIYEQIINELGKVYSLGYEPQNENRDGGWRNLAVKIKSQPNLIAKTRRGYYAN